MIGTIGIQTQSVQHTPPLYKNLYMENTAFLFPIFNSPRSIMSSTDTGKSLIISWNNLHQYIDWCQEYGPSTTLAAYIRPSHKYQVNQTSSALATNWMYQTRNHPSRHVSLRRRPVASVGCTFLVNITELISPPRQLIRTDEGRFLLQLNMNASSKSSLYVIPS